MTTKKNRLPYHARFFIPIITALKDLGGSGIHEEVRDHVIDHEKISESELELKLKNGQLRFNNQISWNVILLRKAHFVDTSKHGVWSLNEKGFKATLSEDDVLKIYHEIWSDFVKKKDIHGEDDVIVDDESEFDETNSHRVELLQLLKSLSPSGFERICQRLLRESGFQQVVVTGKSGDGGIDGLGLLEINPLVSFKVIFQFKRYDGAVSASQIRDFRGAMMGRADKGIILTTGRFTQSAKKEAIRDGVPPIELVDAEKIVEMFEQRELGLKPKTVYEIDKNFFLDYM